MAVSERKHRILFGMTASTLTALVLSTGCKADDYDTPVHADSVAAASLLLDARSLVRDGASRFETTLRGAGKRVRDTSPDWLKRRSGFDPFDRNDRVDDGGMKLVVQQHRPDGADLMTVRYVLGDPGSLQSYAGAGISRTRYFNALTDLGPTLLVPRNGHSDLGAAFQAGAELRISEKLRLSADLRWADLPDDASALRAAYGPVGADPVTLGLKVGYRFR